MMSSSNNNTNNNEKLLTNGGIQEGEEQPEPESKTRGRRAKLAAPKARAAAVLFKHKQRIARKRNNGLEPSPKDNSPFVPVRRKPLGEYMKLELPEFSSAVVQGMSYAAAVATVPLPKSCVKVLISPRIRKPHKPGKGRSKQLTADAKFSIFEVEQPKTHIVHVDRKLYQAGLDGGQRKIKGRKSKPTSARSRKSERRYKVEAGVDIEEGLAMNFRKLSTGISNSVQDTIPLSAPAERRQLKEAPPLFKSSFDYLSFHQQKLQRILEQQGPCAIERPHLSARPSEMNVITFENPHCKHLTAAALLAQNRTMLARWMNDEQLIY